MATRKNRTHGTAVLCIAILTALASACTEPYTAPPLGPTPPYVDPGPLPAPAPNPGTLPLAVTLTIGPNSPSVGNDAAFMAAVSAPMTAPIAYAWTFGDGGSRTTSTETTFYTFSRSGSFQASVKVTDAKGLTATGTAAIAVQPRTSTPPPPPPPTPVLSTSLSCTPQAPLLTPTLCNVTASYNGVTVPSSAITNVAWAWGDNNPGLDGPDPVNDHVYTQTGTYTVVATLTANTIAGSRTASGTAMISVTTATPPPTLTASLGCTPQTLITSTACNVTATFNGATVPSSAITNVDWYWGDSNPGPNGPNPVNNHVYAQVGTYTVVATVTAATTAGPQTATGTATISVTTLPTPPPAPILTAVLSCTPQAPPTPTPCNVTASYNGATLPSSDLTNVHWEWDDGTPPGPDGSSPLNSHVYTQMGTYTVVATVTATTSDGSRTATGTKEITVTIP